MNQFHSVNAALCLAFALGVAGPARAAQIFGQDFQINDIQAFTPDSLQLTSASIVNDRSSAFLTTPLMLAPSTSFKAEFSFRVLGGTNGADGLTWTLQNDRRGAGYEGLEGGNDGFFEGKDSNGLPLPWGPAFAVAFDTFRNADYGDADDNHVATLDHTTYQVRRQSLAPFDLNSGAEMFVWIDYSGSAKTLSVYLNDESSKPDIPLLVDWVDLYMLIGGQAYVGFTASTGPITNTHVITSFGITSPVPLPQAWALYTAGLLLLRPFLRRSKAIDCSNAIIDRRTRGMSSPSSFAARFAAIKGI